MVQARSYLRNRETSEVVRVVRAGVMVDYRNADVEGQVLAERLPEHFEELQGKPADADQYF